MGLIRAAKNSISGVLADQWKEFFTCDSISNDILVKRGYKKNKSNNKGSDNVITNGSKILVNEGQCMLIVDQGQVVEVCAEPGEYVFDTSSSPSIFAGDLGDGIAATFKEALDRIGYAGHASKDQRIYYVNTKEITDNKYGTPQPIPFRVVDANVGLDMDISITCFGTYSYRITDPILFYTNVTGNVSADYSRATLDNQMRSELLTALQPAFAKVSSLGIRYSALPASTIELTNALNDVLSEKWGQQRGIQIVSMGMNSVKASEEDEAMIKEIQRQAVYRNANMGAAALVGAQADAMKAAASNSAGAFTGFMGMGMAQQTGGMDANALYAMGAQQQAAAQAQNTQQAAPADGWTCSCGAVNTGKFCAECGSPKPEPKSTEGWTCSCGTVNTGKFCQECGSPRPEKSTWTCPKCGKENEGKFCQECGTAKP